MKLKSLSIYVALVLASVFLFDLSFAQTTATSTTSTDSESSLGNSGFGMNLFSLGGVYTKQLENRDPSVSFFENYIGMTYRPNRDLRLGARYSFTYKTEGLNEFGEEVVDANKSESADMSFTLQIRNILEDRIPSAMELRIQPRLYLPTSDKSKQQGMIGSLRLETEMRYFFNREQSVRLYFQPRYYFQRNTAFLTDRGSIRTTEMAQSKHGFELVQKLNRTFAIKPGMEIEENWSNASPVNDREEFRGSTADYRLGLEMAATRNLNFTVGYSFKQNLIEIGSYDKQITLMTNATIF